MTFDKTKPVEFDFDENGICKPNEDGLYDAFYHFHDESGVSETEAIWQWLVAEISLHTDLTGVELADKIFNYLERLVYLARKK